MFGRFERLINNVESLNEKKIFLEIVNNQGVQAFIISLNTVDQIFEEGIQSTGFPVTSGRITSQKTKGYYSELTFQPPYEKQRGNPFTIREVIDFDETGGVIYGERSRSVSAGDSYILFETGSYLSSFRVEVDSGGFVITAKDGIHSDTGLSSMTEEYGDNLLGLTDENKDKLAQQIVPLVVQEVKRILLS